MRTVLALHGLGRYREQLPNLNGPSPRQRVLVLRYRELADEPDRSIARACDFLGVRYHPAPIEGGRDAAVTSAVRRLGRARVSAAATDSPL